jgi:hypothetical protein
VPGEPLAELPDEITLTRDEAAVILFGLDVIEQAGVGADERTKVTRAIHLLTAKLWPDLGDLLDGDNPS